jgi:CBS domain-containing protein
MTVKDLQTSDVKACSADTDLATVAQIMWDNDCGVVPVVNDDRKVVGMITDRDICIAAATRSSIPADLRAGDVMSHALHACRLEDDFRVALRTMKQERVRRLPVVDRQGRLAGIISMNDLVRQAEFRPGARVSGEELLDTLRAIGTHTKEAIAV